MQRLCAVVTGPDRDPFLGHDGRNIVRMDPFDLERHDTVMILRILRPNQPDVRNLLQPLYRPLRQQALTFEQLGVDVLFLQEAEDGFEPARASSESGSSETSATSNSPVNRCAKIVME